MSCPECSDYALKFYSIERNLFLSMASSEHLLFLPLDALPPHSPEDIFLNCLRLPLLLEEAQVGGVSHSHFCQHRTDRGPVCHPGVSLRRRTQAVMFTFLQFQHAGKVISIWTGFLKCSPQNLHFPGPHTIRLPRVPLSHCPLGKVLHQCYWNPPLGEQHCFLFPLLLTTAALQTLAWAHVGAIPPPGRFVSYTCVFYRAVEN